MIRERQCVPTRAPRLRGRISSTVGRSSGSGLFDRSPSHPTHCGSGSGSAFDRRSQSLEPTHYGGAPAEELERISLRTSLPFSPGPWFGPKHRLHDQRLIHEVRCADKRSRFGLGGFANTAAGSTRINGIAAQRLGVLQASTHSNPAADPKRSGSIESAVDRDSLFFVDTACKPTQAGLE